MKNSIALLENIAKQEISPFLFTRIQQKLKQQELTVSITTVYALSIAFIMLFVVNIMVLVNYTKGKEIKLNVAKELNLEQDNYIYNE